MILAAILMLGSNFAATGDGGVADLRPALGLVAEADGSRPGWDRQAERGPRRDERSSFLCEEDEDDTFDDDRAALGHGFASTVPAPSLSGLFAGRAPRQVTSRSASPTLRLRC